MNEGMFLTIQRDFLGLADDKLLLKFPFIWFMKIEFFFFFSSDGRGEYWVILEYKDSL